MEIGKGLLAQADQARMTNKNWLGKHYLYFIFDEDCNAIKIGVSNNVYQRLKKIKVDNIHSLKILKIIEYQGYGWKEAACKSRAAESEAHKIFKDYQIRNEWFRYEGKLKSFIEKING